MAQAITDYVKFLADARDAVYRLNCDENTRRQLKEQESRQERELETAKKAVADAISQTIRKRREEIDTSYDREIAKGQERLKKARAKREKAKNQGMKERIADETRELKESSRELKAKMKALFQKEHVPGFCRNTLYYALYYPKGIKERGIGLLAILIVFLALPCGGYFLIPERKMWQLIAIYFVDILLFGGLYIKVGNWTRQHFDGTLRNGREIRNALSSNAKKIQVITRSIKKDGNEAVYDLEKYDDEIACAKQELSDIAARKEEAQSNFENVTKTILSDEIEGAHRDEINELERQLGETSKALSELDTSIKNQNIYITDTFGPYLGKEFLDPDRLSELSKLIQSGTAGNITEAIELFKKAENG